LSSQKEILLVFLADRDILTFDDLDVNGKNCGEHLRQKYEQVFQRMFSKVFLTLPELEELMEKHADLLWRRYNGMFLLKLLLQKYLDYLYRPGGYFYIKAKAHFESFQE
jgi:hypothetical protein